MLGILWSFQKATDVTFWAGCLSFHSERDTVVSEAYPVLCMALGVKTTKALRGRGSVRGGADPLLLPTTFLQQG